MSEQLYGWEKAPICGALRRNGERCRKYAMTNHVTGRQVRCANHGGRATGPKTQAGLEKCGRTNLKSGEYTKASKQKRRERAEQTRATVAALKSNLAEVEHAIEKHVRETERRAEAADAPTPQIIAVLAPEGATE